MFINFAMGYAGREEVLRATKLIADKVRNGELKVDDINEDVFSKNVYLESQPDLIIRTGGEQRLSNFLPFQSTYSELAFLEKAWPEIEKDDFLGVLEDFEETHKCHP